MPKGLILAFEPGNIWTYGYGIYSTEVVLHDFGPLSFLIITGNPSLFLLPPVKENISDNFSSTGISSEGTPLQLLLSTGWSCRWSAQWPGPAPLVCEVGFKSRFWQECKQRATTLQLLVCLSSPFWRGTDAAWKLFKIFSKSVLPDSEENPVIPFSLFCICSGSNTTNNYTRNVSALCQTGIFWKSLTFLSGSPFFLLFLPWECNKQHVPADESHEASKLHIQHWGKSFISISIFSWYEVVKPQISVCYVYLLCLLIWAEKSIVVKQPVKQIIVLSLAAHLTVSNAGQHQTHHQSW